MEVFPKPATCNLDLPLGAETNSPKKSPNRERAYRVLPSALQSLAKSGADLKDPHHFGEDGQNRSPLDVRDASDPAWPHHRAIHALGFRSA